MLFRCARPLRSAHLAACNHRVAYWVLSPAARRGATSAIEDAIILAKHLRERAYCVPEALRPFTASRRPIAKAAYRPTPGRPAVSVTADDLNLTGDGFFRGP